MKFRNAARGGPLMPSAHSRETASSCCVTFHIVNTRCREEERRRVGPLRQIRGGGPEIQRREFWNGLFSRSAFPRSGVLPSLKCFLLPAPRRNGPFTCAALRYMRARARLITSRNTKDKRNAILPNFIILIHERNFAFLTRNFIFPPSLSRLFNR